MSRYLQQIIQLAQPQRHFMGSADCRSCGAGVKFTKTSPEENHRFIGLTSFIKHLDLRWIPFCYYCNIKKKNCAAALFILFRVCPTTCFLLAIPTCVHFNHSNKPLMQSEARPAHKMQNNRERHGEGPESPRSGPPGCQPSCGLFVTMRCDSSGDAGPGAGGHVLDDELIRCDHRSI